MLRTAKRAKAIAGPGIEPGPGQIDRSAVLATFLDRALRFGIETKLPVCQLRYLESGPPGGASASGISGCETCSAWIVIVARSSPGLSNG